MSSLCLDPNNASKLVVSVKEFKKFSNRKFIEDVFSSLTKTMSSTMKSFLMFFHIVVEEL